MSKKDLSEMITTTEASQILDISVRGVIGAIERRRIQASKFGNTWMVNRQSVLSYLETRAHAPGRKSTEPESGEDSPSR